MQKISPARAIPRLVRLVRHPAGQQLVLPLALLAAAVLTMVVSGLPDLQPVRLALFGLALCLALCAGLALLRPQPARDATTGLHLRQDIVRALERNLARGRRPSCGGALVVEIDRFRALEEIHDHEVQQALLRIIARRLSQEMRIGDAVGRLDGACFAVALSPGSRLTLETAAQLCGRLQRSLSEPVSIGTLRLHPTVSIGFALAERITILGGESLLQAAILAQIEASRHGPGAVRSFSETMRRRIRARGTLAEDIPAAMGRGEIMPFFQPQIEVGSGRISGFEALARWDHPQRGLIPPAEFLPAVQQAGQIHRLGELMVQESLNTLRIWDNSGYAVPHVSVNFSHEELSDPALVERIALELNRFDMTPQRLVVEVLETVIANREEDVVVRNLAGLARLGCCLDLDDFGTGHAAITSIRRLSIQRIKIDRSFVSGIATDPEQRKLVSAILLMAKQLDLDTLAEGVETAEQQRILEDLGCGHLQGFGIARPMPREAAARWLEAAGVPRPGPQDAPAAGRRSTG
ncbi:putative bifunctional diguanylate cyclase/phosphodiesterase [Pseudoroseicyclus aestuarii]|uniref:Diguanylate cyclase/phosphodiesterase n=1 Tax=Pseudoroseicyclus aestuarii TaxID=1795041 RepID=A0A318SV76_9RHOB|nr:bifunctional diguanylate cyclase/phosphodiesterase [Pseudoroseicyclus aestuarii]PYE83767.1 diguanylate cyclase/phosphodiesterase [Pseudoroseicyclus aestuarii]